MRLGIKNAVSLSLRFGLRSRWEPAPCLEAEMLSLLPGEAYNQTPHGGISG